MGNPAIGDERFGRRLTISRLAKARRGFLFARSMSRPV
jgi:hypothetical protein